MMLIVRFGLLFWLFVRLIFLFEKLRTRFSGTPGTVDGNLILYKIQRDQKRKALRGAFGVVAPDTFRFSIRQEKYFDRVAKLLGIAREFQTGDRKFDEQAYILSEDQRLLTALAVDKALREHITALLDAGNPCVVHCAGGRLWAEYRGKDFPDRTAPDIVIARQFGGEVAPVLAKLRDRLTAIRVEQWQDKRDPHVTREWIFYGASVALAAVAVLMFLWSMGMGFPRSMLFDNAERLALGVTGIGVLALLAAAVLMLRGTSRLHLVLIEILITMAPAAWYVSRTAYAEQNIRADRSPRQEEMIRVVDRYSRSGRRGRRSYYVTLEKWPDARIDRTMQVHFAEYSQLVPGQCVRVGYHGGRYGDPWIDSMEPSANCGTRW